MSKFVSKMQYEMVAIGDLVASDSNPRFELREIEELGASIAAHGIIEPLVVQKKRGGGFTILAGHRRAKAAELAGLDKVPCVIRPASDAAILHLVENTQRAALTPLETAIAVGRALSERKMKQKALAAELSKSETWVSKYKTISQAYDTIPDNALTQIETWKAQHDADKLYTAARKMLGLDKDDASKPGGEEEQDELGLEGGETPELQVIAELKTLAVQKFGVPDTSVNIVPVGKSGYKVEVLFKTEEKARVALGAYDARQGFGG